MAIVGLFFFRKTIKPFCYKLGFLFIPIVAYILFFNDNLELLQNRLVYATVYVECFWTLFCYLLICSFQKGGEVKSPKGSILKIFFFFVLQVPLIALLFAVPWAVDTFPLSNTDSVLFTLFASKEGANNFIIQSLDTEVFVPTLKVFGVLFVAQTAIGFLLNRNQVCGFFFRGPFRFNIVSNSWKKAVYQLEKFVVFLLVSCAALNLALFPCIIGSASFEAYFEDVVDSPLYKEHYVAPSKIYLDDKVKKKNLVLIFYESMVNNFEKYTPELNKWKDHGLSFNPGGVSVSGTSWTIAGIVSAICGIPLNVPGSDHEYHGKIPTYLPYATCLTDLLQKEKYNQVFVQGSSAKFTQKKRFWNYHGKVYVLDDSVFKAVDYVPNDYNVFWGIEDRKVFSYAKERLDSLGKLDNPFAMYLLTVDTHQPEGYLDSLCRYDEGSKFKNVLRCSSSIIDEFLKWMILQPWFDNTIVMVVGDHSLQNLAAKAGLRQNEKLYTTAFILNADSSSRMINRSFTNLDYAPTILDVMGWTLPNHAFGLGRSLLANMPTMLEIYGEV